MSYVVSLTWSEGVCTVQAQPKGGCIWQTLKGTAYSKKDAFDLAWHFGIQIRFGRNVAALRQRRSERA